MAQSNLDKKSTLILYILAPLIILMLVHLIYQLFMPKNKKYNKNQIIHVITNNGNIYSDQKAVKNKLAELYKNLNIHKNKERTCKYDNLINSVNNKLEAFIKNNAADSIYRSYKKSLIIEKINSYPSLSSEDSQNDNECNKFDNMLINLDIIIHMLDEYVCDKGSLNIIDLEELNFILQGHVDNTVSFPLSYEIKNNYENPTKKESVSLFQTTPQSNNADSVENRSHVDISAYDKKLKEKNKIKIQQRRSDLNRTNDNIIGTNIVQDSDLLQDSNLIDLQLFSYDL